MCRLLWDLLAVKGFREGMGARERERLCVSGLYISGRFFVLGNCFFIFIWIGPAIFHLRGAGSWEVMLANNGVEICVTLMRKSCTTKDSKALVILEVRCVQGFATFPPSRVRCILPFLHDPTYETLEMQVYR